MSAVALRSPLSRWPDPFVPERAKFGPDLTSPSTHSMIGPLGARALGQYAALRRFHDSRDRTRFRAHIEALYSHLVALLEAAIRRGDVSSGSRLPPERELASRLRISRTTVVSAYRELESRGLLRGYVGRGTFVCAAPEPTGAPFAWRGQDRRGGAAIQRLHAARHDPPLVRRARCCRSRPVSRRSTAFPTAAFRSAIDRVLTRDAHAAWRHGPTEGQPALREAIAERFGVPAETVLVLSGAQQGLDLLARCLIDPGDAGDRRSARLSRRDPVVPRRRRKADWLGHRSGRHRRARGSAGALPARS